MLRLYARSLKGTRARGKKPQKRGKNISIISENRHVNVKGNKSPFDGDITYWSKRNSKLYYGNTSKCLKKQNHSCGHCGLMFNDDERVHLHHIDGNHDNWKTLNLLAVHQSCHEYIHKGKTGKV